MQLTEMKERGGRLIRRDALIDSYSLSKRQGVALAHILERESITIQEYERIVPDVSRRSLQRDLRTLVEKGLLVPEATGTTDPTKRYVFRVSARK